MSARMLSLVREQSVLVVLVWFTNTCSCKLGRIYMTLMNIANAQIHSKNDCFILLELMCW